MTHIFGIWNFGHCILFDIWDLGFGICYFIFQPLHTIKKETLVEVGTLCRNIFPVHEKG